MAAAQWNLLLEQRADYRPIITYTDSTGAIVNLTGWSARLQIRADYSSPTALLELSDTDGNIVLGADGTVRPIFSASDTGTLSAEGFTLVTVPGLAQPAAQIGVYDLLLTDSLGEVTRLLEGPVYLAPGVTQ